MVKDQRDKRAAEDKAALEDVTVWSILSIALPSLGVLAATPIYLLVDTAVVGHLGAVDLAALAAATTILAQVTTQLTFLSYGTTARSSRFFGAGDRPRAVHEGLQATWLAIGVGLVLATIVWMTAPWLTGALADNSAVAAESTTWLRVASPAIPLTLITMAGNGWLRGVQSARLPLYFTLAGVAPALICVPIFVARWGIVGSAFANVLGEVITSLCFVACLIRQSAHSPYEWTPSWSVMKHQLVLGRDLIGRSLSFQLSFVSAAAVAGRFGASSLAAHQVLLQLWNFLTLVLDSVAIAAQAFVGQALGARHADRARRVGVKVIAFSTGMSAILALVLALGHGVIPRLFTHSSEVLEAMSTPWWLLVFLVLVGGVVFALDGVLLGAGDAKFLRNATLIAALGGFLPLVWVSLIFHWGLVGVWFGLTAFLLFRLAATVWRFKQGGWSEISMNN